MENIPENETDVVLSSREGVETYNSLDQIVCEKCKEEEEEEKQTLQQVITHGVCT